MSVSSIAAIFVTFEGHIPGERQWLRASVRCSTELTNQSTALDWARRNNEREILGYDGGFGLDMRNGGSHYP